MSSVHTALDIGHWNFELLVVTFELLVVTIVENDVLQYAHLC